MVWISSMTLHQLSTLLAHPLDTGGSFAGGKVSGTWSWPRTSI